MLDQVTKPAGADAVQLQVFQKSTGDRYLKVTIRSVVKPGQLATVDLPAPFELRTVEAAAGACAEYLCEHFGDNIDPSAAAKTARKGFARLQKILRGH